MAKTDIGPPSYKNFLPPVIQKNYGKWSYHEILKARRVETCGRIRGRTLFAFGPDRRG